MTGIIETLRRRAETLEALSSCPPPITESAAWRVESHLAMKNAAKDSEQAASTIEALAEEVERRDAHISRMRKALEWYADKVNDCRKLGSDGDKARHDLDMDGGFAASSAIGPA